MPYVAPGEAIDAPYLDVGQLVEDAGAPPWRLCLVGTEGLRVVLLCRPPGFQTVPHRHPRAEETFYVLEGRAAFTLGPAAEREVGRGGFVLAVRDVEHGIRVVGDEPLLLMAAVAPNEDRPDETIETA